MSRKENHQESEIQKERAQKIKDLLDDIWLPKNWDRDYVLEKLHGQSRLSDDYLWFDQLPKIDRQYLFWEDLLKKMQIMLLRQFKVLSFMELVKTTP